MREQKVPPGQLFHKGANAFSKRLSEGLLDPVQTLSWSFTDNSSSLQDTAMNHVPSTSQMMSLAMHNVSCHRSVTVLLLCDAIFGSDRPYDSSYVTRFP